MRRKLCQSGIRLGFRCNRGMRGCSPDMNHVIGLGYALHFGNPRQTDQLFRIGQPLFHSW